ncbi:competence/damage-inducible protein A [Aestuariivirga sp.]|jgi:molybdenum cofactor synthesis domain-containing protein|uniref:competence/damage-inducible protein A n=1 Tax=Aestuariivirga sp. TaxID=2650926 RepID=UPI003784FB19
MTEPQPTAAVLLIGDEILSGRTKDKNLGFLADYLTAIGIDLKEARVVSDQEEEIVNAVNALRHRYTYVFTTGGIGPTHDDITADAVARAFGVPTSHDPKAVEILLAYFREMGREPNEARMRMARVPEGASLIDNPVSKAPGFQIGNVFVMAGVPKIMNAMMDDVAKRLTRGVPMQSRQVEFRGGEGDAAKPLGEIQKAFPSVVIGSYPFQAPDGFATNLVLRSRDVEALGQAYAAVCRMAQEMTEQGKARGWA